MLLFGAEIKNTKNFSEYNPRGHIFEKVHYDFVQLPAVCRWEGHVVFLFETMGMMS